MIPALPAFVLLGGSLVYLVPVFGRRSFAGTGDSWPSSARAKRRLLLALAVLAVVPLGVIAPLAQLAPASAAEVGRTDVFAPTARFPFPLLPLVSRPSPAVLGRYDVYVPAGSFTLEAKATATGVELRWPAQPGHGSRVAYIVYRARGTGLDCAGGPRRCRYAARPLAVVAASPFDDRPASGRWTYRVALATSAVGGPRDDYPLELSTAASVSLHRPNALALRRASG
jgi:hypothetical protein